jgi:hypothetical protein
MTINSALSLVYNQLSTFVGLDDFWSRFDTAFGTNYDRAMALTFKSQWLAGDFSQFPTIEVVSDQVLGTANGAYGSNNTIYVSEQFLSTASESSLVALLLEEYGHFVDAQVNGQSTFENQGVIFAEQVKALDYQNLGASGVTHQANDKLQYGKPLPSLNSFFTPKEGNSITSGDYRTDSL